MKKERRAYRFAIPTAIFAIVALAVVLWNYIGSTFSNTYSGYAVQGKATEAILAIAKDPGVYLIVAGVLLILLASFIAAARAIGEGLPGGWTLLFLLILTVAVFGAIVYVAVNGAIS